LLLSIVLVLMLMRGTISHSILLWSRPLLLILLVSRLILIAIASTILFVLVATIIVVVRPDAILLLLVLLNIALVRIVWLERGITTLCTHT